MDDSAIDTGRSAEEGVREPSLVPHRRDSPWPFRYSVLDRGIVINRCPPRKKSAGQKEVGDALW